MGVQIKSKKRVADHGEVFTATREVKAMCDLVADECLRIDSRFLEPAVGEGVFLAEVLKRKLSVVKSKYKTNVYDYERNAILALTSIYGIDILLDNTQVCQEKLFNIWNEEYTLVCKNENINSDEVRTAAKYILQKNIVLGNALSLMCVDENQQDTDKPIIFSEWTFPFNDSRVKRRDFRLDVLLRENQDNEHYKQLQLFGDDVMNFENWMFDPVTNTLEPKPIAEYPLVHYRRIVENG
ncbi:MAG: hypothetical protein ACI4VX_01175 [Succinivibrionaceae bacterium]